MPRRPFCAMAVAFICGSVSYKYIQYQAGTAAAIIAAMCIAVPLAVYAMIKSAGVLRYLVAAAILAAALCGYMRTMAAQREYDSLWAAIENSPADVTVSGRITKKEYKNYQYIYYLSQAAMAAGDDGQVISLRYYKLMAYFDEDALELGSVAVLCGTVSEWNTARNEGDFDELSYYTAQGYAAAIKSVSVKAAYGRSSKWREALWRIKMRWREVYANATDAEAGGILSTMVLGDKTLLDSDVKRLYQICGISHILAISGLHISVIGATLYRFLRRRGLPYGISCQTAALVMYSYGSMIGMGTSVRRALVMFLVMLGADLFGRGYDSYNALGLAALILLAADPGILFDAGFQFSFTAVIGAVWAGKTFRGNNKLLDTCAVTFAIQLFTMPFALWYYYEVPVYAVLINMIILPAMGLVLGAGIIGGLAGLISINVGRIALIPACLIIRLQLMICTWASKLPGAMAVIGKPAFRCIVVYYALLVLSAYFCRKLSETDDDGHLKISGKPALIAKSGIIALVSVMITILCLPKVRGLEVDVLDVGQGDASYIHTTNGTDIFVDGGSSDVSKAGEYRILTFLKSKGVGRIDCWFFSHMDSDHTSGFLELMEADYEVGCLMVGVNLKGSDEEVLLAAEERGISIVYLEAGDAVHFGEGTVKVLSPEPSAIISDANEDSLVFEIADGGFTGIFTGDIGESTEKSLIASGTLGEADFYKTAHHGSKYSNTYDFLQALSPKLAVISCGANNSYGHPSDEAIENISATGARIYITMNDGQVKIRREKDGLTVWTKK